MAVLCWKPTHKRLSWDGNTGPGSRLAVGGPLMNHGDRPDPTVDPASLGLGLSSRNAGTVP